MSTATANPVPSRMVLQSLKVKQKAASTGYSLLKKKSDALTARFRSMLKEIVQTKHNMVHHIEEASYNVARAAYSTESNFISQICENVRKPMVTVNIEHENIAGVHLPIFKMHVDQNVDVIGAVGISSGGHMIRETCESYRKALQELIRLASLQTAFFALDEQIKMTNRRVNALDNVVIPRLNDNIHYILKELDEGEREDFYRLKKVTEKKRIQMAIQNDERMRKEVQMMTPQSLDATPPSLEATPPPPAATPPPPAATPPPPAATPPSPPATSPSANSRPEGDSPQKANKEETPSKRRRRSKHKDKKHGN